MSRTYYREDTSRILLTATRGDGSAIFSDEVFAGLDGGDAEAATEHVYPGNAQPSVAIGGLVTPQDVTAELPYSDLSAPWVTPLKQAASNGRISATVYPLEADGEPNEAAGLKWTGVIKSVKPPKRDSAASGKSMLVLTFTPDGE